VSIRHTATEPSANARAALPLVDDLQVLKDVERHHQQRQAETGEFR
jgi:hypothetical protein